MSVHVTTGNHLDVVYTYGYPDRKMEILGLQPWDGELIPLPDPEALVSVLTRIIKECKDYKP